MLRINHYVIVRTVTLERGRFGVLCSSMYPVGEDKEKISGRNIRQIYFEETQHTFYLTLSEIFYKSKREITMLMRRLKDEFYI